LKASQRSQSGAGNIRRPCADALSLRRVHGAIDLAVVELSASYDDGTLVAGRPAAGVRG
jgi:hypothetical protein